MMNNKANLGDPQVDLCSTQTISDSLQITDNHYFGYQCQVS